MGKKIVILNGSPRPHGNTETLAEAMIKGIHEAGNDAVLFNLREMQINPCVGCFACMNGNGCVQKDEMQKIFDAYNEADILVFGSPLQWMQFTGSMKTMLDRLLTAVAQEKKNKGTFLLMTAGAPTEIFDNADIVAYYQHFVETMGWMDEGHLLAGGVGGPGYTVSVEDTDYIRQAYEIGKGL